MLGRFGLAGIGAVMTKARRYLLEGGSWSSGSAAAPASGSRRAVEPSPRSDDGGDVDDVEDDADDPIDAVFVFDAVSASDSGSAPDSVSASDSAPSSARDAR